MSANFGSTILSKTRFISVSEDKLKFRLFYQELLMTIYLSGEYLNKNPSWHEEDSKWKASHIHKILSRNKIEFNSICEVGCGAGGILLNLQNFIQRDDVKFVGYEISPQAYEICKKKENKTLSYILGTITTENVFFDICMLIDVFEHIDDYTSLLKSIKEHSRYKVFHIPLDISLQSILRTGSFISTKEKIGHVHFFTAETAIIALEQSGYKIIDYFYTSGALDLAHKSFKRKFTNYLRGSLEKIDIELSSKILGGYSLMLLAI